MLIIIISIVFAASFMLVYAIMHFVVLRRDPVRARLEQLAGDARVSDDYNLHASLHSKGVDLLASNVQNLSSSRERLARAGYHRHDAVYKFYIATFILSLVGLSAAAMTGMLSHLSMTNIVLMAGAGSSSVASTFGTMTVIIGRVSTLAALSDPGGKALNW